METKWIKKYSNAPHDGRYFCEKCGHIVVAGGCHPINKGFQYCPNCGRKARKDERCGH
jgi:hypothetical protein